LGYSNATSELASDLLTLSFCSSSAFFFFAKSPTLN